MIKTKIMNNISKISALLLTLAAMTACGGAANSDDSEAMALVRQAREELNAGNQEKCLMILDSVARAYINDTAAIRQVINLRPVAIEGLTVRQIAENDSAIAAGEHEVGQLKTTMRSVALPSAGEYYVANVSYDPDFMSKTGISARSDEFGQFYIVSCMNGQDIKYTSISLSAGANGTVQSAPVALDNARNYTGTGARIISFTPAESDTIGKFVAANERAKFAVNFIGNTTKSVNLTDNQVKGIADAYRYSQAVDKLRRAYLNRERLNQRLQVAREQQQKHSSK